MTTYTTTVHTWREVTHHAVVSAALAAGLPLGLALEAVACSSSTASFKLLPNVHPITGSNLQVLAIVLVSTDFYIHKKRRHHRWYVNVLFIACTVEV